MNKHIKRKFQVQHKLKNSNALEVMNHFESELTQDRLRDNFGKNNLLVQLGDDEVVLAFIYKHLNQYIPIPLPDFTLVYFDFSYRMNIKRHELQQELLNAHSDLKSEITFNTHSLFEYYGVATTVIISLFTSIESFINHLLPPDEKYVVTKKNRTEYYDREQIQKNISFDEKIGCVIPQLLKKDFFKISTPTTIAINNLKELRNRLVHTKSDNTYQTHIETFKKLLTFKYENAFAAVKKYYNSHEPNYIEDCPCGENF